MRAILLTALSTILLTACATQKSEFNLNAAIQKVGSLTTPGQNQFFMFNIPEKSNLAEASIMLARHLKEAASARASVGVVGSNYSLNYSILKQSLSSLNGANLSGVEILFLGNQQNFNELELIASSMGAKFKATSYP